MLTLSPEGKQELLEYCINNTFAFGNELKCYEPYPKGWLTLQKLFRNQGGSWKGKTSSYLFLTHARPKLEAVMAELQPQPEKVDKASLEKTPKAHADASLQMVPTALIVPDPNQPRKYFDETAQAELIESVKANGILQPLLLRPQKGDLAGTYLLVCGERRYRAALSSDLTEVPCVIRELTDAEALELQIIENLQRKDVHPMEEAVAFKSLIDQKQMNDEEIAARIGKKSYYVRQRLKLNALTPKWQSLFFKNAFPLVNALMICQLAEQQQNELYKEEVSEAKEKSMHPEIVLHEWDFKKYKGDLAEATFDLTDPTLNPKMGACTTCPFNSAVLSLFPDQAGAAKCNNISCYTLKTDVHFDRAFVLAQEDPSIVYVSTSYSGKISKKVKGVEVLKEYTDFSTIDAPEMPDWDEYKEDYVDEETSEEEAREEFAKEMAEYEEELLKYKQKISSAKAVKAFVVSEDQPGKYIFIERKKNKSGSHQNNSPVNVQESNKAAAKEEIQNIKDKEKRNKELDGEKVYQRALDELKNSSFSTSNESLHNQELIALCVFLADSSTYDGKKAICKLLNVKDDYDNVKLYKAFAELGTDIYPIFHRLVRDILYARMYVQYDLNAGKSGKAAAMFEVAKTWIPDRIQIFETEQKEKADKRQANVNKRIAALQKQKTAQTTSAN